MLIGSISTIRITQECKSINDVDRVYILILCILSDDVFYMHRVAHFYFRGYTS